MTRRSLLRLAFAALFAACSLPGLRAAAGNNAGAEDDRPVVNDSGVKPEKPAAGKLPTLWIAGDSTVKSNDPMRGWGQDLGRFFDPAKINVVNRAIGGRSTRTFMSDGRWQAIVDELKAGDWVIIQFGHNDVGRLGVEGKFRGTLKGVGDETEDVTKPDGGVETVHSYGWYLKTFARTARAKGANVILCSPIPHKKFDAADKPVRDWKEYRAWVAECAKAEGVYYVDLCELIARGYDKLKKEEIEAFFADKGTHTNAAGSLFNTKALVSGLRAISGAPLDATLSAEGKAVAAAR